jgi:hypothetical protein
VNNTSSAFNFNYNQFKSGCLFLSMLLLSSCANLKTLDAPIAENFIRKQQKESQASRQWNTITEGITSLKRSWCV